MKKLSKKNLLVPGLLIVLTLAGMAARNINLQKDKPTKPFDAKAELATLKAGNHDMYTTLVYNIKDLVQKGDISGSIEVADQALREGDISFDQCHNVLHLIGHEAYAKYKTDFDRLAHYDSQLCIASFEHGVEGEIVTEKTNVTQNLENYCIALRKVYPGISCYHGAGHGYMFSLRDPKEALKGCDLLANGPDPGLWNCYRGVFSEYANEALGVDSDTGLSIAGPPPVKLDFNNPFSFCDQFDTKYRDDCYTQLTKIVITTDPNESIKNCLKSDYSDHLKEICVHIVAGVESRSDLSSTDSARPLPVFYSLAQDLKQAYILGVRESYVGYSTSNLKKDWSKFCQVMGGEDQNFCLNH